MAVTDFSTKTHSPSHHPWTVYTGNKTCFCLFWTCDVTYGNNYIQLMTWDPLWLPGGLCSVQCISPSYSLETCCQVPLLNMRCTSLWWQVLFFSQYNHTSLLCSLSSALGAFCLCFRGRTDNLAKPFHPLHPKACPSSSWFYTAYGTITSRREESLLKSSFVFKLVTSDVSVPSPKFWRMWE